MKADAIIAAIAAEFGVTVPEIRSRRRSVISAKREATRRLRLSGFSLPEIGKAMNCHHTTALWRLRG